MILIFIKFNYKSTTEGATFLNFYTGIIYVYDDLKKIVNLKNKIMAEIHVQAKKSSSSAWVWILISLIIIAAVAVYILMRDNGVNEKSINKPNQTSFNVYKQERAII